MNIDPVLVRLLYPFIMFLFRIFFMVFGPLHINGNHNIPKKGGLLILANHLSNIDPIVIQTACKRRIYFMAKKELFMIPIISNLITWFGAFPVSQKQADRKALRQALNILKSGNIVALFPEGETSKNAELQEILPGASWLAKKANVPIVCCGIIGTNKICAYGSYFPKSAFQKIKINWGETKVFQIDSSLNDRLKWIQSQLILLTKG